MVNSFDATGRGEDAQDHLKRDQEI